MVTFNPQGDPDTTRASIEAQRITKLAAYFEANREDLEGATTTFTNTFH